MSVSFYNGAPSGNRTHIAHYGSGFADLRNYHSNHWGIEMEPVPGIEPGLPDYKTGVLTVITTQAFNGEGEGNRTLQTLIDSEAPSPAGSTTIKLVGLVLLAQQHESALVRPCTSIPADWPTWRHPQLYEDRLQLDLPDALAIPFLVEAIIRKSRVEVKN